MSYYLRHDGDQAVLLRHGKGQHDVMLLTSDDVEPEIWTLLLRGAGLDGETVRVSRKDVQNVLEALSEPMMHESHFDAARRLEGAVQRAGEATR